ncbi:MAG: DUF2145 domain-containing protein [Pseudomonadota bacterium]
MAFILLVWSVHSHAECRQTHLSVADFEKSTAIGLQLLERLEALQPQVALVGRVGSDLEKYGIKYSHAGLVFRDHPKGKWVFTHLLNRCATRHSELFDEGIIPFFSDTPHKYEAILVIPDRAIQSELQRLLLIRNSRNLHGIEYSALANPFSDQYQNSNQWILEMIAVAKSIYLPEGSRRNALFLAKEQGYLPDTVKVGFFKKIAASVTVKNISFDDHDARTRRSGHYPFVSVRSLIEYLKRNEDIERIEELAIDQPIRTVFRKKSSAPTPARARLPATAKYAQPNSAEDSFWSTRSNP